MLVDQEGSNKYNEKRRQKKHVFLFRSDTGRLKFVKNRRSFFIFWIEILSKTTLFLEGGCGLQSAEA